MNENQQTKIYEFLADERGIYPDVVDKHIANGNLKYTAIDGYLNVLAAYKAKDTLPAVQRLTIKGKAFKKGSKASSECFFIAGCEAEQTDTIMIHEAVIDALSGECLYSGICHVALGSTTLTGKVSVLRHFVGKKKIIVCQDNDEAGNNMVESIRRILGYEVPCIQWADGDGDGMDMNDLLKLSKVDNGVLAARITPALDADLPPASDKKKDGTFKLTWVADMKLKPANWLIKNLIEVDSMNQIYGPPESAKTFCMIDMACSIATGSDFNGMPVKQGPVVYITGEGQSGIMRRLTAWGKNKGIDINSVKVAFSNTAIGLTDIEQVKKVKEAIHTVAKQAGPPVAIIVDTIARNFGPGDENSTKDMTQFVNAGDEIKRLYGSAIIFVHHTGKADQSSARGSSVLKGALDTEYKVTKDKQGNVRMENTKMKDKVDPTVKTKSHLV